MGSAAPNCSWSCHGKTAIPWLQWHCTASKCRNPGPLGYSVAAPIFTAEAAPLPIKELSPQWPGSGTSELPELYRQTSPPRLSSPCYPHHSGNNTQTFGTTALSLRRPRNEQYLPVNLTLPTLHFSLRRFACAAPGNTCGRGKESVWELDFMSCTTPQTQLLRGNRARTKQPLKLLMCCFAHQQLYRSTQAYKGLQNRDFSKYSFLPQNWDPTETQCFALPAARQQDFTQCF